MAHVVDAYISADEEVKKQTKAIDAAKVELRKIAYAVLDQNNATTAEAKVEFAGSAGRGIACSLAGEKAGRTKVDKAKLKKLCSVVPGAILDSVLETTYTATLTFGSEAELQKAMAFLVANGCNAAVKLSEDTKLNDAGIKLAFTPAINGQSETIQALRDVAVQQPTTKVI